eukprot:1851933-Pyramimonas_sp.AAC.1
MSVSSPSWGMRAHQLRAVNLLGNGSEVVLFEVRAKIVYTCGVFVEWQCAHACQVHHTPCPRVHPPQGGTRQRNISRDTQISLGCKGVPRYGF